MGWASGSRLFNKVIAAVQPVVPDFEARKSLYASLVEAFRDHDWDTLDECVGKDPAYDAVYAEKYPDDDEDD